MMQVLRDVSANSFVTQSAYIMHFNYFAKYRSSDIIFIHTGAAIMRAIVCSAIIVALYTPKFHVMQRPLFSVSLCGSYW